MRFKIEKIAIVIPYINNDGPILKNVLDNILNQATSSTLNYTIVAVCNSPSMQSIVVDSDKIVFLHEANDLNSPYSARNTGIKYVESAYYVFLDATCIPSVDWWASLEEQVKVGFELLAANVKYFTPNARNETIGDTYDSIVNIDNEASVKQRRVAKTACLAVNAKVINSIGCFESKVRSGGDVFWTKKATNAGFTLTFFDKWVVEKQSRSTFELIKKQYRVAKGWPLIWKQDGVLTKNFIMKVLLCFLPPSPGYLFSVAKRRKVKLSLMRKFLLLSFGIVLRITSALGVVVGLFKKTN